MTVPTGRDYRNFPKIKALLFLKMILETEGDHAMMSAGQIARGSDNKYSIRSLLRRWSQHDWIEIKHDGQRVVRHGYHYVEECNGQSLGMGAKYLYRITKQGTSYLQRASRWYQPYQEAVYAVVRVHSLRLVWAGTGNLWFYVRSPFQREDFGYSVGAYPVAGNSRRCMDINSAFSYAEKNFEIKPTKEFRALVVIGVQNAERLILKNAPNTGDGKTDPSAPSAPDTTGDIADQQE
jgi:hypothetical protein